MDRRRAARIAAETLDAIDKGRYTDAVGRTVGYPPGCVLEIHTSTVDYMEVTGEIRDSMRAALS